MDALTKQPHRKAVRSTLDSLPAGLNDTYLDALVRIGSQDQEDVKVAHQVLSWVSHAFRPLSLQEIQHALAVEPGDNYLDEESMIDEDLIISVCYGMVKVEQGSSELQFVHETARNYFEQTQLEYCPDPHQYITLTCLTYLALEFFPRSSYIASEAELQALERGFVFLDYAARNWGSHARKVESSLQNRLGEYLTLQATYLSSRMAWGLNSLKDEILDLHREHNVEPMMKVSGLHVAAYFGLQQTAASLLYLGHQTDSFEYRLDPAIHVASARNDTSMVHLLLKHNTDINVTNIFGYTPLQAAARGGHLEVVELLLSEGAEVNAQFDARIPTALHLAAVSGHVDMVRLLLRMGADVNMTYEKGRVAPNLLESGASSQRNTKTKTPPRAGANLGYRTDSSNESTTPLGDAVEHGLEEIVSLLVSHGANVNLGVPTPLKAAVNCRHCQILRLLLEHGANLLEPLFHGLVFERDEMLMRTLQAVGADLDAQNEDRGTAVLSAVIERQEKTVRFLIEAGANINIQSFYGDSPLFAASRWGHEAILQLLLVHGADVLGIEKQVWLEHTANASARRRNIGERRFSNERSQDFPLGFFAEYLQRANPSSLRGMLDGSVQHIPDSKSISFIPADALDEILTFENIEAELEKLGKNELSSHVFKHARKVFAILVHICMLEDIQKFIGEGLEDADLPLAMSKSGDMIGQLHTGVREPKKFRTFSGWRQHVRMQFWQFQWVLLAPIFSFPGQHHKFDDNIVLPYVDLGDAGLGAYSKVYRVKIHPAHAKLIQEKVSLIHCKESDFVLNSAVLKGTTFALKQLTPRPKRGYQAFQRELSMLKSVQSLHHPHIVQLLATYERKGHYSFLFPLAEENLRQFWRHSTFTDPAHQYGYFQQMAGLASAISSIHNLLPLENAKPASQGVRGHKASHYGYHNDIKPENILVSLSDPSAMAGVPQVRWVLADFGFGGIYTKGYELDHSHYTASGTYQAPECQVSNFTKTPLKASQYQGSDIFSLGCVFLEVAIWMTQGPSALERFGSERSGDSGIPAVLVRDDNFFTLRYNAASEPIGADMRPVVQDWIEGLQRDPTNSDACAELLLLIKNGLLQVDGNHRLKAKDVHERLSRVIQIAERDFPFKSQSPLPRDTGPEEVEEME